MLIFVTDGQTNKFNPMNRLFLKRTTQKPIKLILHCCIIDLSSLFHSMTFVYLKMQYKHCYVPLC